MKVLKKYYIITLLAAGLLLVTISFSGTAVAEQSAGKDCASSCAAKKQACYNINVDKMPCEKEYQSCLAACKSQAAPSSPAPQEQKSKDLAPALF